MKIPTPVVRLATRALVKTQKNSPTLLLGAGVVGVVTSTVMACKATLKLQELVEDGKLRGTVDDIRELQHEHYSEQDRRRDLALVYTKTAISITKLYAPSVTLGALSLGCLVGSNRILNTRNAGLMAAYATLEKGFDEYRARVLEEAGPEKERELRYAKGVEHIKNEDGTTTTVLAKKNPDVVGKVGASIYARFFDEHSPNWSRTPAYNQMFIRCQQNYANDLLRARGHLFLNEVYDMLGLPRSMEGQVVGWVLGNREGVGDEYVDFGVFEGDVWSAQQFINGDERSILLDFNVDGVVHDKI